MYQVVYTRNAVGDIPKLKAAGLAKKTQALIGVLRENPFQSPPTFEKLQGSLAGAYSRRINIKHRLVYQIVEQEKTVKIISMWTYYEF